MRPYPSGYIFILGSQTRVRVPNGIDTLYRSRGGAACGLAWRQRHGRVARPGDAKAETCGDPSWTAVRRFPADTKPNLHLALLSSGAKGRRTDSVAGPCVSG